MHISSYGMVESSAREDTIEKWLTLFVSNRHKNNSSACSRLNTDRHSLIFRADLNLIPLVNTRKFNRMLLLDFELLLLHRLVNRFVRVFNRVLLFIMTLR